MASSEMILFMVLITGVQRCVAICFSLKKIYISKQSTFGIIMLPWLNAFSEGLKTELQGFTV